MTVQKLKIHCLQHVPYETPGTIAEWAEERGHRISFTRFFNGGSLPLQEDFDWLIVMGGPMGVHDDKEFQWLVAEKAFIQKAIENGKTIVGVCLGAQLLADALGARVYRNEYKEIGWFPVHMTSQGAEHQLFEDIEPAFTAFHWHGDTFDLPAGASHMMYSEACPNQAFFFDRRILGLQFHLEMRLQAVKDLLNNNRHELTQDSPFIQEESSLLDDGSVERNVIRMNLILDRLYRLRQPAGV